MYIPNEQSSISIGDTIILNNDYSSCAGTFTKGSVVKVIDCVPMRGYGVEDEYGNKMYEMGFDIGTKVRS